MEQDIRWVQRFSNYKKALSQLKKFIDKGELNELEEQGLIQAFEYTFELAWNTLKDFLQASGNKNIFGSRDAIREAFKADLLEDGEGWMEMYKDRNRTSHTYNEETAAEIAEATVFRYFDLFVILEEKMEYLLREMGTSRNNEA
ncbi:nucleotidyltransferase substrate binding protein [Rubrolithibacter danxiaensis]|uniref:nucleotidyltransferase substrate binding protein n=1 Tax=Rubrolithibacter danxiaensis TaxID=3390805 RepID=UPI003BF7DC3F